MLLVLFNTNAQCFAVLDEALQTSLPDDWIVIDNPTAELSPDKIAERAWFEGDTLCWSGKAPSDYHRWARDGWELDESKQAELLTQQRNQIRNQINAKRDACVNGGVYVPAIQKWVDTDEKGRATLVEIKADFDLNGKDNTYTLICADNSAKIITFEDFKAVWDAVKNLKEAMFANAYKHKVLLEAEANPLDYDWSTGWSQTYEEHENEQGK
ncbi:DUF4376 domain-containing protein [Avibacterium avium]|uniref:DUF4376 domain-containing protein n=1 Tax=Avibacterium avium TaxID=751 RepID=UPI003BF813FC